MGTHPIFESDFDCLTESDRIQSQIRILRNHQNSIIQSFPNSNSNFVPIINPNNDMTHYMTHDMSLIPYETKVEVALIFGSHFDLLKKEENELNKNFENFIQIMSNSTNHVTNIETNVQQMSGTNVEQMSVSGSNHERSSRR